MKGDKKLFQIVLKITVRSQKANTKFPALPLAINMRGIMPTKSIITVDFFAVVVRGSPFEFKFIVRLGLVQDYIIVCTVGWVGWGGG